VFSGATITIYTYNECVVRGQNNKEGKKERKTAKQWN
jgi:hypothetical protein